MRKPVASQQTSSLSFGWGDLMPLLMHACAEVHFLQILHFPFLFFVVVPNLWLYRTPFRSQEVTDSDSVTVCYTCCSFRLNQTREISCWHVREIWNVNFEEFDYAFTAFDVLNAVFQDNYNIWLNCVKNWLPGCCCDACQFVNALGDTLLPFIGPIDCSNNCRNYRTNQICRWMATGLWLFEFAFATIIDPIRDCFFGLREKMEMETYISIVVISLLSFYGSVS